MFRAGCTFAHLHTFRFFAGTRFASSRNEDTQNMQKTKADKKRKQAQAIGNPNLLEDEAEGEFHMEVEQDNPEVRQRRLCGTEAEGEGQTSRTAI